MPELYRELKGQNSFAADRAGPSRAKAGGRSLAPTLEQDHAGAPKVTAESIMKEREEQIRKATASLLMSKSTPSTQNPGGKIDRKLSHIEGVDADLLVKSLRSDGESSDEDTWGYCAACVVRDRLSTGRLARLCGCGRGRGRGCGC